jgi:DoxX-like family
MQTMSPMSTVAATEGSPPSTQSRVFRVRTIAYWTFTLIIAWEMVAGSMWDLLQIEFTRAVFDHLGYPHYLLLIIGVWKLPCALALLAPRFERLKEWAYAGAFFNYTGAAASHFLVGDVGGKWFGPMIFGAITLASWALRPADRRLPPARPTSAPRPLAFIVALGLAAAFLVLALLTLPKGTPAP